MHNYTTNVREKAVDKGYVRTQRFWNQYYADLFEGSSTLVPTVYPQVAVTLLMKSLHYTANRLHLQKK